jgi:hypothetical protein
MTDSEVTVTSPFCANRSNACCTLSIGTRFPAADQLGRDGDVEVNLQDAIGLSLQRGQRLSNQAHQQLAHIRSGLPCQLVKPTTGEGR